ncbi:hypothetical protein ABFG93_18505 [Pseudalkalibacillus hwajinpoensis]|uniref:hypothetical protein n=1 Tax=Guptibacillus hwajinpoensis TaxID=208199 RepID=UPI00325BE0BB
MSLIEAYLPNSISAQLKIVWNKLKPNETALRCGCPNLKNKGEMIMLTIHLVFVTIGIRVHEKTLREEEHYLNVKGHMACQAERIAESQPWLY